jgi:hypothetical protein
VRVRGGGRDWLLATGYWLLFRDETKPHKRATSRLMLCVTFADPFATSHLLAVPDDVEDPLAAVVWPRNANLSVLGQRQPTGLSDLLQRGLGICKCQRPLVEVFQIIGKLFMDEIEGRLPSTIEDDRADHRFEEVLEEGRTLPPSRELLTWSKDHPTIEPEQGCPLGQPLRTNQVDTLAGQHPLIVLRKLLKEDLRHRVPDHGIAEELEPLIRASLLRRHRRSVSQSTLEKISIFETMTEEIFEFRQGFVRIRRHERIVQIAATRQPSSQWPVASGQ